MLPLFLVIIALAVWSVVRLSKSNRSQPFSRQAMYVSVAFAIGLILLSQKGWLVFALIPLAVILAVFLYFFWKMKTVSDTQYSYVVTAFIVSTVIAYMTVLGLGDGFTVLAWSIIATLEGSVVAQSSQIVSIIAGGTSVVSFIWLYAKAVMRK